MVESSSFTATLLLVALGSAAQPDARAPSRLDGSPYPAGPATVKRVYVVDDSQLPEPHLALTVTTLQGLAARSGGMRGGDFVYRVPTLNGTDSYNLWLRGMRANFSVDVDNRFAGDVPGLVRQFASVAKGYVLFSTKDAAKASIPAAISLCSALDAIAVPDTPEGAAAVAGTKLLLLRNASAQTPEDVFAELADKFSDRTLAHQDPDKYQPLSDYSVFGRMFSFYSANLSASDLAKRAFGRLRDQSAVVGWGSEHDLVKFSSARNSWVNAADWAHGLATLTNLNPREETLSRVRQRRQARAEAGAAARATDATQNKTTVAFLMSDGDNIQWLLNTFATDASWFGSPQRGAIPMGWTLSPALCEMAPSVLDYILTNANPENDSFVGGPSGVGYTYPELQQDAEGFASLSGAFMKKSGMDTLNILSDNPDPALAPLLASDDIRALFVYLYADYSGWDGKVTWVKTASGGSKPAIGGRHKLWKGFETPKSLAKKLNAMSTDPASTDSYALVPVHVWSYKYSDVVDVVSMLNADRVRVVTPDVLVDELTANVVPPIA